MEPRGKERRDGGPIPLKPCYSRAHMRFLFACREKETKWKLPKEKKNNKNKVLAVRVVDSKKKNKGKKKEETSSYMCICKKYQDRIGQ